MAKIPQLKGKPKYKDAPRFPLIYEYEGAFKAKYGVMLGSMTNAMAKTMSKIVNPKK